MYRNARSLSLHEFGFSFQLNSC